jgi:hypothetical protein
MEPVAGCGFEDGVAVAPFPGGVVDVSISEGVTFVEVEIQRALGDGVVRIEEDVVFEFVTGSEFDLFFRNGEVSEPVAVAFGEVSTDEHEAVIYVGKQERGNRSGEEHWIQFSRLGGSWNASISGLR